MKRTLNLLASSLLVLGTGQAFANPNFIDTVRQHPTALTGSDTVNKVMDDLISALGAQLSGGINTYQGLGSSTGERQLEGSPNAGEPTCTPNDGNGAPEANPGCQEISPMSRPLGNRICEDDPNHPNTVNEEAEGLAFCADGLVIIAHNDSLGAYGDDAAACAAYHALANTDNTGNVYPDRGVGRLRNSGALSTGYAINDWKDVLRLVYTGCKNTDGTCAGGTDRVARCSSAERQEVIDNWGKLFDGVACAESGGCPTGVRHAYRRDDASGTTGVFLELLGVAASTTTNLASRSQIVPAIPSSITPIPGNLSFCDGGQNEGFLPTHLGPATAQFPSGEPLYTNGDPIRKNCAAEDDLCGPDGKLGVVRPIRSTSAHPKNQYPGHQCKRLFGYAQFINTALPVCPDRTKPSAGRCKFPLFEDGAFRTFNCVANQRSADSKAVAGTDGRTYNYVIHEQDGTVLFQDGATRKMPYVANYRQNMANLNNSALANGKVFVAADYVCTEDDATRNIGCLTANSKCTIGYAGREAAFNASQPTVHLTNEPAKLNGFSPSDSSISAGNYPFSRFLFMNASRGFENIMEDCKNRGGSEAYCNDQLRIAQEFYTVGQTGNILTGICLDAGFIPLTEAKCIGAQGTAGCGMPATQPLTACQPDTRSYASLVNNN